MERIWGLVFEADKYKDVLDKQQEEQAKKYLESIGREAKVQASYVDKKLANINVNAANELLQDDNLSDYPYWIGSKENIKEGKRYKYEIMGNKPKLIEHKMN